MGVFKALSGLSLCLIVCQLCVYSAGTDDHSRRQNPTENVNDFDSVDSDADGSISVDEFEKWYKSTSGSNNGTSQPLFRSYDANSDGLLTLPEFVPLAYALSRKPEEESDKIFKQLDKNSDGILLREEFKGPAESESKILPEIVDGLFQAADANGDGKISASEFKSEIRNEGLAQSLMASIDVDKDQYITVQEIYTFSNQFNNAILMEEVESVLNKLDANSDKKLSLSEVKMMPQLLQSTVGIHPMRPVVHE